MKNQEAIYYKSAWLICFAVLTLMMSCNSDSIQKISIAVLQADKKPNTMEMDSLRAFLGKNPDIDFETIKLESDKPINSDDFDIIWIHYTDTASLPEKLMNRHFLNKLNEFTQKGGSILLTMEAMKMLQSLGLEDKKPGNEKVAAKDYGYGRKRGLHAYLNHPVFRNMHGGAYILNPKSDTLLFQTGYLDKAYIPKGKVVAVDWAYIHLHENKKLMLEYKAGKGKVMAIGAYVMFAMPNFHQKELEAFMNNVLSYLHTGDNTDAYYWDYSENKVEEFDVDAEAIALWEPTNWEINDREMQVKNNASPHSWDVAGERMLVMGKENGGIEEIWAHPFMAMRDYRVGFRKGENKPVQWLDNAAREITITPAGIKRKYILEDNILNEYITTGVKEAAAVVHYEYSGSADIELFIQYKTRLRLMWPYSSNVTKNIHYTWNPNINAYVFTDRTGRMTTVAGANKKPARQLCGQYNDFSIKKDEIQGITTNNFMVSAIMKFELKNNEHLEVLITASSRDTQEALSTYGKCANNTSRLFVDAKVHYKNLLENSLMIISPDNNFNRAYQWALVGTDRFFVHTPGIGKSLVAGYATTAKGWDGNHTINGRPGYAWYFGRDGQWSGFAVDNYGGFENVKAILEQYIKFQHNNGKIYHELTTSGVVHYDAADATPLFIVLAGHYLRHSGDEEFIRENWGSIRKAIDFCFSTDTDQDRLIENTMVGHGWVEGGYLFGGKTTLYLASCWAAALDEAALMAKVAGEGQLSEYYAKESGEVKKIINNQFWNEKTRHFNHSINADGSFIEDITIMPAIPLYYEQIPGPRTQPVLEKFANNNFSSDWGVRITSINSKRFNPRGYHTGSVWPLYTGWVALSEFKNQKPLNGFIHLMNNLMVYKHWSKGFIEEVLHGKEYKPSGVCAHQCWSETMAIQPLIEGMLGFKPHAVKNLIELSPAFPVNWDTVSVNNIRMGNHILSMKMERNVNSCTFTFLKNNTGEELKLHFSPVLEAGTQIEEIFVNGKKPGFALNAGNSFVQPEINIAIKRKTTIDLKYNRGIGIFPLIFNPQPNDSSEGLRVISAKLTNNTYQILSQAPAGSKKRLSIYTGSYEIQEVSGGRVVSCNPHNSEIEILFGEKGSPGLNYVSEELEIILQK